MNRQSMIGDRESARIGDRELPKRDQRSAISDRRFPTAACIAAALSLLLIAWPAIAQEPEPEPPPEAEEEPAEERGTLLPRPEQDAETEAWVRSLVGARPRSLSIATGPVIRHVMTPQGDRFYYHREVSRSEGEDGKPRAVHYALYTVGPDKTEARISETGACAWPPLFLPDGRILFATRRYDINEDGTIDDLDDASLMVSNQDGGNMRSVATLAPGEVPIAAWREGREALLAVPGENETDGWIVSLNLQRGSREQLVQAHNVALVLDDGRLLIERVQAAEPDRTPTPRIGGRAAPPEEVETPAPTILDHVEYLIFNPAEGSAVTLFKPSRHSRIVTSGEGSFFGVQARDMSQATQRGAPAPAMTTDILIIDDAEHRDTRAPSARFSYEVLAWIEDRGLLIIERGNLGSRLMLLDRALKAHRIADFDFTATGFVASRDGLSVGWLEVEDTNKDGHLEPWQDNARPFHLRIE